MHGDWRLNWHHQSSTTVESINNLHGLRRDINPEEGLHENGIAQYNKGNYKEASIQMMDSRWASQVGQRSERLRDMMESGEDSTDF